MTKPTDAMIEAVDWRKLAINLAMREADYRLNHDVHGDGHINAGRAWDRMRRSGDAIRKAALSATDGRKAGEANAPCGDLEEARCGDVGANLCNACSQPIGDLTQYPGCGGPLTNLTTQPSPSPDALLREALDCAYQAISDVRYPPIGDSAKRRIERYQKLATSIDQHLKAGEA